ncbi:GMC family oxidoreductase [Pseudonocardia petroleophila]|uniref:GMC family oxidoreductase N-terminal domain-containing protein n=1 Tax=Pseudonocardia petroleophila TaxID=37331 RepID=A0A7G7MEU2_9PSEU|nr:GMC family oxidoreductase N-terminal domain-containing protein [Pseudonocardia petroleophila]QNG51303.1 GMC family oxidoreductase N-terminal domain-containing protein [Pseudonocardia petroleophila]
MPTTDPAPSDYVVVGGGTAGCVLARRLLDRTDGTVLLLEAGGSPDGIDTVASPPRWVENIGAAHDWGYTYAPTEHVAGRTLFLSRGRVLGGSGSTNALVWARGHRADYDGWAAAGARGWDHDSVLPHFRASEDWEDGASAHRGAGGPVRIERPRDLHPVATALIEAGVSYGMPYLDDMNVAEPLGAGPINTDASDGVRTSTYTGHLRPVLGHERLTVVTGARATRLRIDGGRCTGVEYLRDGRPGTVAATREVVLAAGAIDSPRLLLLSGVGPAAHLRSVGVETVLDLPGVGRNLQEHPILGGVCFAAREALPPPNNNLEGSTAFWRSDPALEVPDLMYVAVQIPYVSPEIADRFPVPPNAFVIAPGLMTVRSRGFLELTGPTPDHALHLQPNMLAERADVDALVTGVEIALDLAAQPAFAKLVERRVAPGEDTSRAALVDFVRQAAMPYFHPVGTCAMGVHDDAVVDPDLRVRGVDGLRVADASVMPTITSANTNAPTAMIAERAAELIAAG